MNLGRRCSSVPQKWLLASVCHVDLEKRVSQLQRHRLMLKFRLQVYYTNGDLWENMSLKTYEIWILKNSPCAKLYRTEWWHEGQCWTLYWLRCRSPEIFNFTLVYMSHYNYCEDIRSSDWSHWTLSRFLFRTVSRPFLFTLCMSGKITFKSPAITNALWWMKLNVCDIVNNVWRKPRDCRNLSHRFVFSHMVGETRYSSISRGNEMVGESRFTLIEWTITQTI